jgi:hypothetical protein
MLTCRRDKLLGLSSVKESVVKVEPTMSKFDEGGDWSIKPGVHALRECVKKGETRISDLEISNGYGKIKFWDPVHPQCSRKIPRAKHNA